MDYTEEQFEKVCHNLFDNLDELEFMIKTTNSNSENFTIGIEALRDEDFVKGYLITKDIYNRAHYNYGVDDSYEDVVKYFIEDNTKNKEPISKDRWGEIRELYSEFNLPTFKKLLILCEENDAGEICTPYDDVLWEMQEAGLQSLFNVIGADLSTYPDFKKMN